MINLAELPMSPPAELDRLLAAFRDNPRSAVFVPLALGYLRAGRASEAIDVLTQGLESYPDHPEALLALGQAYMALHRWKDAEREMVKVVKLDRYSQRGFSMLGEILARRGNYDVAVKALQRALDLDPLDERSRRMIDRARVRRPLDPPDAIPGETQPQMARADRDGALSAAELALGSTAPEFDEGPTTVGAVPPEVMSIDETGPTTVELIEEHERANVPEFVHQPKAARPEQQPAMARPARAPLKSVPPVLDPPVLARASVQPVQAKAPAIAPVKTPAATPPQPVPAAKPSAPSQPAPVARETRRRRSTQRPIYRDPPRPAGAEEYLNQLLDARPAAWQRDITVEDGLPVESWGQRVRRPFMWLWLVLFTATAAGGGWYLADIWARNRAVERHLAAAHAGLIEMSAGSLGRAEDEATLAISRHPADVQSVAMLANARAFALLVYGDGQASDVETVISAARQRVEDQDQGENGRRELLLARAAFALAVQNRGSAAVADELKKVRGDLDAALVDWPQEPLVYWLNGLARLASGDRGGAREALRQAHSLGLPMARVTLADMDFDEGDAAAAVAGYEEVLKAAPTHSLALAGRALARSETSADADAAAALAELEPTLTRVDGKRAEAWARLAVSRLAARAGDHERAGTELDAAVATGTTEPRFLARAALALLDHGHVERAFTTRTRVRSRSAEPLLPVIDAELLLAGGRPDEAIRTVGATESARAKLVRGRALIDVGRPADAMIQLEEALRRPATAGAATAWLALARVHADAGAGVGALAKLAEGSPLARGLLGEARLRLGDSAAAARELEGAFTDNPLAYRVAGTLALLALQAGKPADAEQHARTSLGYAPGYLPAHAALGRALVALGKQSEAGPELKLVVDADRASAADELAYAEASLAQGDAEAARAALARATEKNAAPDAVARVAALVDPQSAVATAPATAAPAKKPGNTKPPRRKRR